MSKENILAEIHACIFGEDSLVMARNRKYRDGCEVPPSQNRKTYLQLYHMFNKSLTPLLVKYLHVKYPAATKGQISTFVKRVLSNRDNEWLNQCHPLINNINDQLSENFITQEDMVVEITYICLDEFLHDKFVAFLEECETKHIPEKPVEEPPPRTFNWKFWKFW